MSEFTKGLRDMALAFGKAAAAKQFNGRKGHGQSERVTERHMHEPELQVLLAAAFEAGAELGSDRDELIAALRGMVQWAEQASDQYPASKWGAYTPENIIAARAILAKVKS